MPRKLLSTGLGLVLLLAAASVFAANEMNFVCEDGCRGDGFTIGNIFLLVIFLVGITLVVGWTAGVVDLEYEFWPFAIVFGSIGCAIGYRSRGIGGEIFGCLICAGVFGIWLLREQNRLRNESDARRVVQNLPPDIKPERVETTPKICVTENNQPIRANVKNIAAPEIPLPIQQHLLKLEIGFGGGVGRSLTYMRCRNRQVAELVTPEDDETFGDDLVDGMRLVGIDVLNGFKSGQVATHPVPYEDSTTDDYFGADLTDLMRRLTWTAIKNRETLFLAREDVDAFGEELVECAYRVALYVVKADGAEYTHRPVVTQPPNEVEKPLAHASAELPTPSVPLTHTTTAETIRKAIKKGDFDSLVEIYKAADSETRKSITGDENCPDKLIVKLMDQTWCMEDIFNIAATHRSDDVRLALANNTHCPIEISKALASDIVGRVRLAFVNNPATPEDLLRKFSESPFYEYRLAVFQHPNCPVELREKLAKDKEIIAATKPAKKRSR